MMPFEGELPRTNMQKKGKTFYPNMRLIIMNSKSSDLPMIDHARRNMGRCRMTN